MKKYSKLAIVVLLLSCSPIGEEFFESIELESSKNERIYINTVTWGVTGDYQATVISTDENRLQNKASDTVGVTQVFSPFIYEFKNDTLNLYFKNDITYRIQENFETIHINYIALDDSTYSVIYNKAYVNEDYSLVPKRKKIDYPSDMPKPVKN